MANMNISKSRFYTDLISYNIARGVAQNGNYDIIPTDSGNDIVGYNANEVELFDLRPLNQVTLSQSRTSDEQADDIIITLDLLGDSNINYVAILNHNLDTCRGAIRISASDTKSHIQSAGFSSATAISCSSGVNTGSIATNLITPAYDGSTITTFSESHLRYWGIQIEGEGSNSGNFQASTNVSVGAIMIGRYFDMPTSPDMAVKRSIQYNKTRIQESLGGQRYASSSNFGRVAGSPFSKGSNEYAIHGGKLAYDMKFSYLQNTDMMPDEYGSVEYTDTSFVGNVWNITDGNNRPFIFSVDSSSTGTDSESEHIFARFDQDTLDMTQSAHNVFNVGLSLSEEF